MFSTQPSYQAHNGEEEEINATHAPHQAQGPEPRNPAEDLPFDERLVLQDDGEGDPHPGRPPRAPTPPPHEDHHQHGDPADAFAPGPANPPPNPSRNNRVVGTKKAKAIRRRNEERQYNEWIREQAQVRRLQDEEGREEREAALAAAYTEGKDRTWVERLIRASGLLQQLQQESSHVMFTGRDWLVRIDQEVMARAYAEAERFGQDNGGKVGFEDFGGMLEKALLARANV
ncbi:Adeno-PV multi-domain protein [Pyrenophora tritici-repentis]|nr:Adeno-PV multi-domain protein [Pyrenophora tritici-repentis]